MIPATSREQPYPGLRPFDIQDQAFFFGRDAQIDALSEKLRHSRFVAVVGGSGCGKSSLVRAGLQPLLLNDRTAAGFQVWRLATMRPQGRAVRELAGALLAAKRQTTGAIQHADDPEDLETETLRHDRMEALLRRNSLGLIEATRELRLAPGGKLCIIVDQFEEVFRFHSDKGSLEDRDEANSFIRLLLRAARDEPSSVHVVLTMRLDFLGECARFQGLPEAINDGQFLVPNLSRAQRRAAIEEPAKQAGKDMSPALLQSLLNDAGDDPDNLPVLQHALMRMWWHAQGADRLELEHYTALGGMERALSDHADAVYEGLNTGRRKHAAERLFKAITELDRERRVRRRPRPLGELAEIAGVALDEMCDVIEAFRAPDCCFLMPPAGEPLDVARHIDISHESLMRRWGKLRGERDHSGWITQEAEDGGNYRRLLDYALDFRRSGDLLSVAALERSLAWWDASKRNPAWAERYGGCFSLVERLLETSDAKHDADLQVERRASARNKRMKIGGIVGTTVIATLAILFWNDLLVLWHKRSLETIVEELKLLPDKDRMTSTMLYDETRRWRSLWHAYPAALDTLVDGLRLNEALISTERGLSEDVDQIVPENPSAAASESSGQSRGKRILTISAPSWIRAGRLEYYLQKQIQELAKALGTQLEVQVQTKSDSSGKLKADLQSSQQLSAAQNAAAGPRATTSRSPEGGKTLTSTALDRELSLSAEIDLPSGAEAWWQNWALLDPTDLKRIRHQKDDPLDRFFEDHASDWKDGQRRLQLSRCWTVVPRWSYPIWKVEDIKLRSLEAGIAIAIRDKLNEKAHDALNAGSTATTLGPRGELLVSPAMEALSSQGGSECLREKTAVLLQSGTLVGQLPYLLDEVSNFPGIGSDEIANRTKADLVVATPRLPDKLPGLARRLAIGGEEMKQWVESIIPAQNNWQPEPPVRVYLSNELVGIFAPDGKLSSEIADRLDKDIRRTIYREYGVIAPGVRFRPMSQDVPGRAYRVRFLAQPEPGAGDRFTRVADRDVEAMLNDLKTELARWREWWITADTVDTLLHDVDNLSTALRAWIGSRYTLTDLKLLLRAVIEPTHEPGPAAMGATVRHAPWLMGSLVFWAAFDDTQDTRKLAGYLRETQLALLRPVTAPAPSEGGAAALVREGLSDLDQENVRDALGAFKRATAQHREAAKAAFLKLYPREYPKQLARSCRLPEPGSSDQSTGMTWQARMDLEERFDAENQTVDQESHRHLELCRASIYAEGNATDQTRAAFARILDQLASADPDDLDSNDAYSVGRYIIKLGFNISADKPYYGMASKLLQKAFGPMATTKAETALSELLQSCQAHRYPLACLRLIAPLAARKQDSFWNPFQVANALLDYSSSPEAAKHALDLLDLAGQNLGQTGERRPELSAWLDFVRARAYYSLGADGDESALKQSRELLMKLCEAPAVAKIESLAPMVWANLLGTYMVDRRIDLMESKLAEVPERWRENDVISTYRFVADLARGDPRSAWLLAQGQLASNKVKDDRRATWLRYASMAGILAREGEYRDIIKKYLDTNDDNRDFLRLLLYWSLMRDGFTVEANKMLAERWAEIRKQKSDWDQNSDWDTRLALGDDTVRAEMLIGYYLGKVKKEHIFDSVKSMDDFNKSQLAQLGSTLPMVRCDAYFYGGLLEEVTGEEKTRRDRRIESMTKVTDAGCYDTFEYYMAQYLSRN
jgi:hypothetical protein